MNHKLFFILLLSIFTLTFCTKETFSPEDFSSIKPSDLTYATLIEAREGKAITSAIPSVNTNGYSPYFSISAATSTTDDSGDLINQFSIIDSTGSILIANNNTLRGGHSYTLDIWVSANHDSTLFNEGFSINILNSLIEGLNYPLAKESFVRGRDTSSQEPTFVGDTSNLAFYLEDNSHFSIDKATGAILMAASASPTIGDYPLTVSVNNIADSLISFEDAITITVVSKPFELTYTPHIESDVQEGATRTSQTPIVKASETNSVTYRLSDTPETDFTVNASTGAVTLNNLHNYTRGDTIYVDVYAQNAYGETLFKDAVGFAIIAPTTSPLSNFIYEDNGQQTVMATYAFTSNVPNIVGGYPIVYSIIDGNNSTQFSINAESGVISLPKGNTLAPGNYPLEIRAVNPVDTITTGYSITVTELVKSIIFDGDFTATGAISDGATGNMLTIDGNGNADYATRKKAWYGHSSIKSEIDNKARAGVQFYPQYSDNNDWIYAENVDLTSKKNADLFIEWYQLYGAGKDSISRYNIMVSNDFNGDVSAATWDKVVFMNDIFDSKNSIQSSFSKVDDDYIDQDTIDLSKYDGQIITIAIQALHDHTLEAGRAETDLTRAMFVTEFIVSGYDN